MVPWGGLSCYNPARKTDIANPVPKQGLRFLPRLRLEGMALSGSRSYRRSDGVPSGPPVSGPPCLHSEETPAWRPEPRSRPHIERRISIAWE